VAVYFVGAGLVPARISEDADRRAGTAAQAAEDPPLYHCGHPDMAERRQLACSISHPGFLA